MLDPGFEGTAVLLNFDKFASRYGVTSEDLLLMWRISVTLSDVVNF